MKIVAKVCTVVNYILSSILWLLGILTLLFNLLGLWAPWHLVGFGFIFYAPVPLIPLILSIVFSCVSKEIKLIVMNGVSLLISIGCILFTVFVSTGWFW